MVTVASCLYDTCGVDALVCTIRIVLGFVYMSGCKEMMSSDIMTGQGLYDDSTEALRSSSI
jgi:hypothetical protein